MRPTLFRLPCLLCRTFSTTRPAPGILSAWSAKASKPYIVHQGTKTMYDACARPAAYSVPRELRRAGVPKTAEGEEIGVVGGDVQDKEEMVTKDGKDSDTYADPWHATLNLLPTFSTWSQVTMLHMWTLVARLRAEPDAELERSMVHQLTDHHFFDCERVMDINHNLSSAALRQRYLKDLFVQWRGVTMSYDEGLARGDAALAAAVWRNLFRSRDDVDAVRVAAVVGWVRGTLEDLGGVGLSGLLVPGGALFRRRIDQEMGLVVAMIKVDKY